ncbi:MAG: HD domain-containing protein [Actinomycetota bacterium]
MSLISPQEIDRLREQVRQRYADSGQPPEVVRALNEHNDRVLRHTEDIAHGERLNEDETDILKTVAILHDIAKADTHLMLHADVGADDAGKTLRGLGKGEQLIDAVVQGIKCHMGPFPFIDEEAEKYAERTGEHIHHPRPDSKLDRLFYDADMLALIDIEGIEKVVVLRRTTDEFIAEDEQVAVREAITPRAAAYRSAMQSVHRAVDTLFSETARKLAAGLVKEAQRHVTERLTAEEAPAS